MPAFYTNTAIPAPMRGIFTRIIQFSPADFDQSADGVYTANVQGGVNVGWFVSRVALIVGTPLSDASDSSFDSVVARIGDGASTNRFIDDTQINANGTWVAFSVASPNYLYTSSQNVQIRFTPKAGKALNDIDLGSIVVGIHAVNLNQIAKL